MLAGLWLWGSASAADLVDFACDPEGPLVGVAPLAVTCEVVPPASGTWDAVSWTGGDGSVVEGDVVSFSYDAPGDYTVSVRLDGYLDADGAPPPDDVEHVEYSFVTLCGPPEPEFGYRNKGGLDYELVNRSAVSTSCLATSRWKLYRGRSATGEPAFVFDTWEPRVELSEGPWTVRLEQTGVGGEGAAEVTLLARYQLTQDYTDRSAYPCSTGPLAAGPLGALVVATLARRRRRSPA
ncbi:MAG: PKD domain-containing protein [Myxococcota bacterium]